MLRNNIVVVDIWLANSPDYSWDSIPYSRDGGLRQEARTGIPSRDDYTQMGGE